MKTRTLIAGGAIIASVAAAFFFKGGPAWREEPGEGLVLSSQGTSHDGASGKLEIRCAGGKTEVRLYIPMHALPPAGQSSGPPTLDLNEEFRDAKGNVLGGEGQAHEWVAAGQDYATRPDGDNFVSSLAGKELLYLRGVAFAGEGLTSSLLIFPIRGLDSYRAKMSEACGKAS